MPNVYVRKCVSAFLSVSRSDIGRGFIMTVGTAAMAVVGQSLEAAHLPTGLQWRNALMAGLTAGIMYLAKQFFSGPPKSEN